MFIPPLGLRPLSSMSTHPCNCCGSVEVWLQPCFQQLLTKKRPHAGTVQRIPRGLCSLANIPTPPTPLRVLTAIEIPHETCRVLKRVWKSQTTPPVHPATVHLEHCHVAPRTPHAPQFPPLSVVLYVSESHIPAFGTTAAFHGGVEAD